MFPSSPDSSLRSDLRAKFAAERAAQEQVRSELARLKQERLGLRSQAAFLTDITVQCEFMTSLCRSAELMELAALSVDQFKSLREYQERAASPGVGTATADVSQARAIMHLNALNLPAALYAHARIHAARPTRQVVEVDQSGVSRRVWQWPVTAGFAPIVILESQSNPFRLGEPARLKPTRLGCLSKEATPTLPLDSVVLCRASYGGVSSIRGGAGVITPSVVLGRMENANWHIGCFEFEDARADRSRALDASNLHPLVRAVFDTVDCYAETDQGGVGVNAFVLVGKNFGDHVYRDFRSRFRQKCRRKELVGQFSLHDRLVILTGLPISGIPAKQLTRVTEPFGFQQLQDIQVRRADGGDVLVMPTYG